MRTRTPTSFSQRGRSAHLACCWGAVAPIGKTQKKVSHYPTRAHLATACRNCLSRVSIQCSGCSKAAGCSCSKVLAGRSCSRAAVCSCNSCCCELWLQCGCWLWLQWGGGLWLRWLGCKACNCNGVGAMGGCKGVVAAAAAGLQQGCSRAVARLQQGCGWTAAAMGSGLWLQGGGSYSCSTVGL